MTKAYLNALHEEGTRQDLLEWLCKLDGENDALRAQLASANELAESLQRRLDLEFDSYAKEGWEAKIAKAKRALEEIVRMSVDGAFADVARVALKDLP